MVVFSWHWMMQVTGCFSVKQNWLACSLPLGPGNGSVEHRQCADLTADTQVNHNTIAIGPMKLHYSISPMKVQ